MKISKDTFMSRKFNDYAGNYNKEHILYVARFVSNDGAEEFAKIGVSHYKTNYRFQRETNYILVETYEFTFKTGIEAMGVETAIRAQWTRKFPIRSFHYTVGKEELFQIEQFEETIFHVMKCRKDLNITTTKYYEQEDEFIYHDYTTEFNVWNYNNRQIPNN